jgi:hypothetical protein
VLAVNAWDEDPALLRRFASGENLAQRILLNGSAAYSDYGKPGVPFVVWIGPDGTVAEVQVGFHGHRSLEARTEKLLASGA